MKLKLHFFLFIVVTFILTNKLNATTYTAVASGSWTAPATWDANGVPDNLGTGDVVIPNLDTVTINTNFNINNLTVGGGTSGGLQFAKTDSFSVVINGNLLVNTGASFKVQTNTIVGSVGVAHKMELKGNLTNNGSVFDFRSGTAGSTLAVCNLLLSGTSNCTLTSSPAYSSTNGDFNNVTINKTGGAKVILGSNIAMAGGSSVGNPNCNTTMTFISGIIETGAYIWIFQSSTAANMVGYSSASYINGALGRGLSNSQGSSKDFPVGDANGYELFSLRSTTSGVATGHLAIVRCISGNANTGSSSLVGGIDKVSQVRYYQVSYNQLLGSGANNMSFDRFWLSYTYDDGVSQGNTNLRVAYSTNSRATWNGMNQLTYPHTTKHSMTPPTQIKPDSLLPTGVGINLTSGGNSIYFALARVSGSTENSLQTSVVLHPTVFLEGCTNSGGTAMRNDVWPVTVTMELHDGSTFALVEAQTGVLSSLGVSYFTFSNAVNTTPYYIVVKSANSVETWSAAPQSFVSSFLSYNFSTAAEKAYGSSMVQKGTIWCIYSGDVVKDATNIVDGSDVIAIDNDNTYGVTDNPVTDISGDGIVDGTDVINVDNNNTYGISRQAPGGAPMVKHVMRPGITQKQNIK